MDKHELKNSLKKLEEIIKWFDDQQEVDVEAGLEKVKEGVELIKTSRERLKKLENEFEEVKKGLEEDDNSENKK
ncbi:MAG: exodeoxyribonuclease VII small subunit [bacterium]